MGPEKITLIYVIYLLYFWSYRYLKFKVVKFCKILIRVFLYKIKKIRAISLVFYLLMTDKIMYITKENSVPYLVLFENYTIF